MKTDVMRQTFRALSHRNFRLFWTGQFISLIGSWMQIVAQSWLVFRLTNSPFMLGIVSSISFIPVLLLSFVAGAVADKLDKRKILIATQISSMVLAFLLGFLTYTDLIKIWHIIIIASLFGTITSFDAPTRQSFVVELVGKEDLKNAIGLNSSIFNAARIIGPAIGGILISLFGEAFCFYINAVSYIAVIIGLYLVNIESKPQAVSENNLSKSLGEWFRYIRENRVVFFLLMMVGVISIFGMPYVILMPVFARDILKVGSRGMGFLMGMSGLGSVFGALRIASGNNKTKLNIVILGGMVCSFFIILFSFSKWFFPSLIFLFFIGWGMITQIGMTNTFIQEVVPDALRGRVMSVFTFMLMGVAPLGNFIAGIVAHLVGTQMTVGLCGAVCLFSVIILGKMVRDARKQQA